MITIHVSLYRDAYHGLRDTGEPDWPPSPRRVLGALLAGAHAISPDDPHHEWALQALRRLSSAPPPVIDAPAQVALGLPGTYAPSTYLPDEKAPGAISKFLDLSLFAMDTASRTLKPQDGVALASGTIRYHIDLDCDDAEIRALDLAAHQLPYFGTSRDPADLFVAAAPGPEAPSPDALERWHPQPYSTGSTHGWQANTIDWYEANYQRIFGDDLAVNQLPPIPPSGFVRHLTYQRQATLKHAWFPTAQLVKSEPNHRIPHLIKELNASLGDLSSDWRVIPLTVSHEGKETSANGDGRCVGFGLAPANADLDLGHEPTAHAQSRLDKAVDLLPEAPQGLLVGRSGALDPSTWIGPATIWYSTTPLRAYPDDRVVTYELAQELEERYGVTLADLSLQRQPRIRRNGRWSNDDLVDGLDQWWAVIATSAPMTGPLQLGAATDRGFGTFRPQSSQESTPT